MTSKLKMHSPDLTEDNIAKIAALFPNCISESRDEQGRLKQVVDFDLLRQELSDVIVEGEQERYRLDWVGKKEAILTANAPIAKTLRPSREESVNFDTTENLLDLLRKYPEDLQFPNEIRKPNPKKRQGIQTAHRCNARPFSRNAANHHRSRKPEGQVRQAAYAQLGRPTAAYPKLSAPLPYPTRIGRHLRPFRK